MAGTLGTIRGQMVLDVKQALNAYTQARKAHISTVTALHTGAGALTSVGASFVGVGTAAAAGIGLALNAAAQFDKKMSYFAAVSDTTGAMYDKVRAKAIELGKDTIFSAGQIADSFVELGKSGITAQQIVDGIGQGVAALGAAADIPLDTAANIMTAAIQTFQLGADHAVEVANKLSGAANASIIDVQDLGVSFKYVGGVAHNLGASFDDTITAISLLGQYGIKGSTAGTSLRQILISLTGATKPATAELTKLGIITKTGANNFFDAHGKLKPLPQVFQILHNAMHGLTQEQQVSATKTIFQSRAMSAALDLTKQGAKGFQTMYAEIGKTTALDVSRKRLNNLAGDMEILRGSAETLAISAGGSVTQFARGFIQQITKIINAFISLPQSTQRTIIIVIAVAAAFFILIGFIGLLAGSILNLIALAITLGPVFVAIGVGFTAAATAAWGFAVAILANPITWIVVAIVAVVAALVWFFTQTTIGKQIWAGFVAWLVAVWNATVQIAITVWNAIATFFTNLWNGIVTVTQAVWAVLVAYITAGVNAFVAVFNFITGIPAFIMGVWNAIIAGIVTFVTNAIAFIASFPARVVAFFQVLPYTIGFIIGFVLGVIVRGFIAIGQFIFVTVPQIVNNIIRWFQQLPGRLLAFFQQLSRNIGQAFLRFELTLLQIAIAIVTGVIHWFQQLPGRIISFVTSLVNNVIRWWNMLKAQLTVLAAQIINGVVNYFRTLPGRIVAFFVATVNNVRSTFNKAVGIARSIANNIFNTIRDILNRLPGIVGDIWNNVVNAFKGAVTSAWNAAKDFAAGIWNGFKKGLGINSPSYIEKQMWQITDVVGTETKNLSNQVRVLQGLGNGISRMGENIGFDTSNTDVSLQNLYSQVAAARDLQREFASGTGVSGNLGVTQTQQISTAITAAVKDVQPSVTNYNVDVNNPEPEPASDSIPKAIRKTAYMVGS